MKSSIHSLGLLREQQDNEMREVENYMEHIRTLSDERESLTIELEAENEKLKEQMRVAKQDTNNNGMCLSVFLDLLFCIKITLKYNTSCQP